MTVDAAEPEKHPKTSGVSRHQALVNKIRGAGPAPSRDRKDHTHDEKGREGEPKG